MEHVLLSMQHISKSYPGVQALDDVSLRLDRGQILALAGENGAGKSTLMKILSGSVTPGGGTILLDGEEVSFSNPRQALDAGISIMYQELNYLNDLSIAENIFVGRLPQNGLLNKIDYSRLHKDCSALLERVGLHHDPFTRVRELSVAEKQLVEIAKAISRNIRILIMDEPTSALNEEETKNLFRIIRELAAQKIAIIYISHRMEEVFEVGDYVSVMRDGQSVGEWPIAEVTQSSLISSMVGRDISNMFPKEHVPIGETVLEVKGLTHTGIFEDVSFHVRRGEILGFSGLVGAGRTEVMMTLFGAMHRDAGEVFLNGKPLHVTSPHVAISNKIVYIPEDRKKLGLDLRAKISDNIALGALDMLCNKFGFVNQKAEQQLCQKQKQQFRIKTHDMSLPANSLSGGNQQKVVLAKWLARDVDVLILDEPTRGIDVGSKEEIYHLITELALQGKAIIMISSELPEILGMSDRIMVMYEGRVMGELSADEATQERVLAYSFGHADTKQEEGTI